MRTTISFFLMFTYQLLLGDTLIICPTCPLNTVLSGVSKANPHDTLIFKAGTYACENVEITQPMTLIAENGAVLDGNSKGYVLKLLSDSVTIAGFKLVNAGRSYTKDFAAIYVHRSSDFVIRGNEIEKPLFGLLLEKSKRGLIENNHVFGITKREDDAGNGIHAWHCDHLKIMNNEVHGMRDGIYLEFVDESVIQQNFTHHNIRYGLHFMFSNRDEYLNNRFEKNGAGVAVMFSKFIIMKSNQFIGNWGPASYGLLLKEI